MIINPQDLDFCTSGDVSPHLLTLEQLFPNNQGFKVRIQSLENQLITLLKRQIVDTNDLKWYNEMY